MHYRFKPSARNNIIVSFLLLFFCAALIILPFQFRSQAVNNEAVNDIFPNKTVSHEVGIENYDIRTDKKNQSVANLLKFRQESGKTASLIADVKDGFVDGEKKLRSRVNNLKIEYNADLRIPEVISPKTFGENAFLSKSSNVKRSEILRNFIKQNDSLIGINDIQAEGLKVVSDYTNPSGSLSFAQLEQRINGVPVFRGEIKAGFTKDGKIVRVINNLAPNIEYESISTDFRDPLDAVKAAARHIDYKLQRQDVTRNDSASDDLKVIFGEGDSATTAEKMYFPTEIGVARTAWRVLIWQPVNAYYVIVDAETGTMLWRKNITEDQTQAATYEVYNNSNSYTQFAESPAPLTPAPINPNLGTQGALLNRTNVTLVGNEAPNTFNNKGWIDDGANVTAGNNTIAGLDIDGSNGVDAPVTGTNRTFSSAWNPPPGNPAPGDTPTVQAARNGAVIQMFYVVNRYHDTLYQLGFTEQAQNFQDDNFGRGGVGNDRVSAEGQDSSGTNNANFSTPADGGNGRMQMYRFTGSNPDRDGTTDVDIIIHELTHGLSNRLHGNGSGLSTNMARGMGEGWSDWYAHVLTSEPTDPINGNYTVGGYVLLNTFGLGSTNYYYGIRRFPKAVIAFTGGPNNRPHNPLTFADLNQGCVINDGAYPPAGGGACDQVHNAGEVWSSHLWEVRSLMVARMGFLTGTNRVLQVVTDGMKLAPLAPTFVQERDAIIAAARANSNSADNSADVADVWEGFRRRGMGFSASVESVSPASVTEAFDSPNVAILEPGFSVSDAPGDNDGFPEPGETVTLFIPITNNTGSNITGVSANVNGGTAISYGDIADGSAVLKQFAFAIPEATPCGSAITLNININGSGGARTETRTVIIGQPNPPALENFDGVTAPALPTSWTTAQTGAGIAFRTVTFDADSAPNAAYTPNTGLAGGNAGATLESGNYTINSTASVVEFRNRYQTEGGWDGGVFELSINGGSFQDILTAGGSFIEGGYNGSLGVNDNPLDGRLAWTGDSEGFITTKVQLPASANGQTVKFRWRFGEDDNTNDDGWYIDSVQVFTGYSCAFTPNESNNTRFDYDGDGKTDLSIFRPGPGEWWYLRSTDNANSAFAFGNSTDTMTPADFTGDGKTDIAFWRETSGEWFVLRSEDSTFYAVPFGTAGDIPVPGDFDGDSEADTAVFRPSTNTWFIQNSSGGTTIQVFGITNDIPTVEDFDGDGKDDIAIYRPGAAEFWQLRSQDGLIAYNFGASGDTAVPADFTGDGKADVAVFRESTNEWLILRSEDTSFFGFPFGSAGDIPVPGDYDGDGTADAAVFRPSNNTWYKQQSTSGFEQITFGISGDQPTPASYIR